MKLYSVNEIMSQKELMHGKRVYVEGLLRFGTEDISLLHWPKAESNKQEIWIEQGRGAFQYNIEGLEKLSGKKVVCLGEFQSHISIETAEFYMGFGHLGMWSAQIIATELVYYKIWHEANGSSQT